MSDPRNRSVEARLSAWFDDEVERARADVKRRPTIAPASRGGTPTNAVVAFGVVVILAVLLGGSLAMGYRTRSDEPRPSSPMASAVAEPPASPAQPTVGADLDITGWYWDGIPASIAGEEVLRPAAGDRLGAIELNGLLLGGWTRLGVGGVLCPIDAPCPTLDLGESTSSKTGIRVAAPGEIPPFGSPVVVRVDGDESTLVWSAAPETFVDERFSDGIPKQIKSQRVIHAEDLPEASEQIRGSDSVLLAGWHWRPIRYCSITVNGERPFFDPCAWTALSATPVRKRAVDLVAGDVAVPNGPVILRGHRSDPRSVECPDAERARCEAAFVVDEVVWAGDEWTETDPLSVDEVTQLLAEASVVETLTPVPRGEPDPDCHPDAPPMTWQGSGGPVGRVLVFASTAERERVGPINDYGYMGRTSEGGTCGVGLDGLPAARWIERENVVVEVPYLVSEPEGDVDARFEEVIAALGLD